MVNALAKTETMFTINATLVTSDPANMDAILPIRRKKGAPAGCGTCNLYAQAINSPQSQKLAVGSTVSVNVINEMVKTSHPPILFKFLKFISD
jgi:hypothetical protein